MGPGRPHPAARRRRRTCTARRWATRPTCWPPGAATSARTCTGAISGRSPRSTTRARCSASGTATSPSPASGGTTRCAARSAATSGPHWLTDCFEVVELHVRPAAQGHGLGAAQLRDAARAWPTAKTTLLSTPEADEATSRAWRLYRRFGFVDVIRQFTFPGRRAGRSRCSAAPALPLPTRDCRCWPWPLAALVGAADRLPAGHRRRPRGPGRRHRAARLRRCRSATRRPPAAPGPPPSWSRSTAGGGLVVEALGVATGVPVRRRTPTPARSARGCSACRWSSRWPGPGWPGRPGCAGR